MSVWGGCSLCQHPRNRCNAGKSCLFASSPEVSLISLEASLVNGDLTGLSAQQFAALISDKVADYAASLTVQDTGENYASVFSAENINGLRESLEANIQDEDFVAPIIQISVTDAS